MTTIKSSVKADVRARSRGLYDVTFVPQEAISHFVNVTFNDEDVPGNPFQCEVSGGDVSDKLSRKSDDSKQITAQGEGLKEVVLGSPAFFEIDARGREGQPEVKVSGLSSLALRISSRFYRGIV